jgi:hypothetical protein
VSIATCQDAAHHESAHATALAVRTGILTETLYVASKPDGTHAAGINDASRIPATEMKSVDLIIYNLAGYAAECLFNPNADRDGALRDDIVVEKILRMSYGTEAWAGLLDLIEDEIAELLRTNWKCIQELAAALLAVRPRIVNILGEEYRIYKLSAPKIEGVLNANGVFTSKRFGTDYTDAIFEKQLERQVTNIRLDERSQILANEFRHWRRFSEMKVQTLAALNHQAWLDHFGIVDPAVGPTPR